MPPSKSKRTSATTPMEIPLSSRTQPVSSPIGSHPVPLTTTPSGAWCPPYPQQSMAPSYAPYWIPGVQHPGMASSSPQGPWWAPPSSTDTEDSDLQVLGVDSIPPGGMLNFLSKNSPRHGPAQPMNTGNSSQPISVGDDTNESD